MGLLQCCHGPLTRFDLAPTLARQEGEFGTRSAFFDLVARTRWRSHPLGIGEFATRSGSTATTT